MKVLTLALSLMISSAASASWMNCRFTQSQVVSGQTGEVMSRSTSPKIIRGSRDLDIIQNGQNLLIYTSFGSHIQHVGYPDCYEGGDCFRVQTFENPYREYTITFDNLRKKAVVEAVVMFGNKLQETYVCR